MMYLLDTNVVSESRKVKAGKGDPRVKAWTDDIDVGFMFLSTITILELELGTLLMERRDRKQGALLRSWLENQILPAFASRVLAVDIPIAQRAAALQVPNPRPYRDALIAATALVHRMTLVTRDIRDVESTGVTLLNPWDY
jgi:predicted nucleic acid-binding protein